MDNLVLILTVLLNVIKDIAVLIVFGALSFHFNNIWVMLLGCLFVGGYTVKINSKEKKTEGDDKLNG